MRIAPGLVFGYPLYSAVDTRRLVVYLANETAGEVLSIGGTARSGQLQALASLLLKVFNGRVLNLDYWRIRGDVRDGVSAPFLPASKARSLLKNIRDFAEGRSVPSSESEWFTHGAELMRKVNAEDRQWRTKFQEMYRNREQDANKPGLPLDDFIKSVTVKELVLSRVAAICADAGAKDPTTRASELLASAFKGCPALGIHLWIRIARLWWYTESTREGRTASMDYFDDALLGHLAEHDVLVTPDSALLEFGRIALPEKQLLTPEAFRAEYLDGA